MSKKTCKQCGSNETNLVTTNDIVAEGDLYSCSYYYSCDKCKVTYIDKLTHSHPRDIQMSLEMMFEVKDEN
jgi:hypothetical protein